MKPAKVILSIVSVWALVFVLGVAVVLTDRGRGDLSRLLPLPSWLEAFSRRDEVAYPLHAGLGTALNWLGGSPLSAGAQWIKAVGHARSDSDIDQAARGIADAKRRSGEADRLEAVLCVAAVRGASGRHVLAVTRAGLFCGDKLALEGTVPDDVAIEYATRPPISGLYYDAWYPHYGLVEEPVPATIWVHNLAHGAIVLLYKCPHVCSDLVEEIRELHAGLAPGRNAHAGGARLLVIQYLDMDQQIAVVAWGQLLILDRLDSEQIRHFYELHVDRGPECRALTCPN